MVTKTRGGAPTRAPSRAAKKPVTRSKRAKPSRPPFWRVQARDLWAVGLITLGVLLALALWGKQLGPIGHAVDTGLALVAGWVRVLLPLVAFGAGCALLFDRGARSRDEDPDESADPWRLAVGTVLGLLGVCGLAELAKKAPRLSDSRSLRDAGGYLGAIVGRPLHAGLGTAGAAVLLVAVVLVAILIATGVSLNAVGRALRTAATATARTSRSLWEGKPFVTVPDGATDVVASVPPAPAPRVPEDTAPLDHDIDDDMDDDIDIPLDPEPEPAEVAPPPLVAATPRAAGEWVLPGMSLLSASPKVRQNQRQIDAAGEELVRALAAHGVETRLQMGISKFQSHCYQSIARVPEDMFERHIEEVKKSNKELTTAAILRMAQSLEREGEYEKKRSQALPLGKYHVIYADPPWEYANSGFNQSAGNQYPTMSLDKICALDVRSFTGPDCALLLWVTAPMLSDGLKVIEAWGFEYKTNFVWVKDKAPGMGWHLTTFHEHLLLATVGTMMPPKNSIRLLRLQLRNTVPSPTFGPCCIPCIQGPRRLSYLRA